MSRQRAMFILATAAALAAGLAAGARAAGPPFITDDPEPIDYKHWELYLLSTMDKAHGANTVQTPAVEMNYGFIPNAMVHLVVPMTLLLPTGQPHQYGLGDAEVGVKMRFVEEKDNLPAIGAFPLLELPTGDADRGLGNGRAWAQLPIWLQKTWDPWTLSGGGGYAINRAPGQRDYFFGGALLLRQITKELQLGGEFFARGPDHDGGRATALYNLGGYYNFSEHFSLIFTVGHTLTGDRHLIAYVALYWTWGPPGEKNHNDNHKETP